jgi:hypothetical protein
MAEKTPKERARFIQSMGSPGMKAEVIWQMKDMATGGNGGSTYTSDNTTVRETYYKYKTDEWFSEVLEEYTLLARASKKQA